MKVKKMFFCVLPVLLAACNKTEVISPDPLPVPQRTVEKVMIRAEFRLNNDTLRGDSLPGVIEGAGEYEVGSRFTISAKAKEGYELVRFFSLDTDRYQGKDRYSDTVRVAQTFRADFVNLWKITVPDADVKGREVSGGGTYRNDSICTLMAVVNPSYTFLGWQEGNKIISKENPMKFKVTHDREIRATFANLWTVKVPDYNAVGRVVSGAGTFRAGEQCTLTAIPGSDYVFIGWKEGGKIISTANPYRFVIDRDREIRGEFIRLWKVNVPDYNAVGRTVSGAGTFRQGETCTLTAKPDARHAFVGWKEGGKIISTSNPYRFVVDRNREIRGEFVNLWTVSVPSYKDLGTQVTGAGIYRDGSSCVLTAIPNEYYKFAGWKEGGKIISTSNPYRFAVSRDRQIEAYFKRIYKPESRYSSKKLSSELPQEVIYRAYFERREPKFPERGPRTRADIELTDEFAVSLVFDKDDTLGGLIPSLKKPDINWYKLKLLEVYVGGIHVDTLIRDERLVKNEFRFTYDGEHYVVIGVPDKDDFFP